MKKLNLINKIAVAFAMLGLLMCVNMQSAYSQSGVGINTSDAAANANAMLDVQSTTKGVLLTPMTAAQANTAFGSSLSVAAQGLTVYITSGSAGPFISSGYWYNTSSTTTPSWVSIGNGSVTLVATGYGLTGGPITTGGTLSADTTAYATSAHSGFLKYNDWTTFNAKQNALAMGNLTDAGTDGITVTNGTGSVIGSGTSIAQQKADGSHNGYLSSGDWTNFNGKGSGNGSVTGVSPGYGTNFSTITTTGSIVADTSVLINKTGTQTLTNKSISGSSNTVTNIGNSSLTNSSVTVSPGVDLTGGGAVSLGSSVTLNADTTKYATSTNSGFLKYSDWTTFNAKQNALAIGNLTDAGTDGITVPNGTGSVIGSGTSVAQQKADGLHNGYLSSGDWTFNGKGSGNGSVTSVSPGYGTNFSTITTTGSIVADTSVLINKTGTQTLTNKTISGSSNTVTNIGNSSLTNSSVTVSPGVDLTGGGAVSLGSSVTLNADTTQYATSAHSGFLKYADWTTFNNKQNALSLGTGVATALGMAVTGSGGIALATSPTFTTPILGAATATSVNGLTLMANSIGFAIVGGTTSKTLTVSNSLTLAGNDGSTLNIGGGGTLGSNAYTSTAYAPLASPTFTGTPAAPTATAGTSTTQIATTAFVANNFAPTGTLMARKIITSGTTVSIDAGTNAILVELIGGGGGGGGTNGSSSKTDCGSGGGAGGYTSYYLSGPFASPYTCAIGAGGSGGPNTGGAGSDGGTTSITVSGTTISANGGKKGSNTGQVNNPFSVAGGAGASTGANGTFMTGGAPGEIGLCTGTNTGGGGNGGSSVYGGGGLGPVVSTATSNGANATGYGGGGSGSASGTSGTGGTGGNGSGGCIIVWEYR